MYNKTILAKINAHKSLTSDEKSEVIEDMINECSWDGSTIGVKLSKMHRYLQNEFGKCVMAFVVKSALNYRNGCYDQRNAWFCTMADLMLKGIEEKNADYAKSIIRFHSEIK